MTVIVFLVLVLEVTEARERFLRRVSLAKRTNRMAFVKRKSSISWNLTTYSIVNRAGRFAFRFVSRIDSLARIETNWISIRILINGPSLLFFRMTVNFEGGMLILIMLFCVDITFITAGEMSLTSRFLSGPSDKLNNVNVQRRLAASEWTRVPRRTMPTPSARTFSNSSASPPVSNALVRVSTSLLMYALTCDRKMQ